MSDWHREDTELWTKERRPVSPGCVVYRDLIRGWCWDVYDTNSDPIDGAGGFESADAAKNAADLWLATEENDE